MTMPNFSVKVIFFVICYESDLLKATGRAKVALRIYDYYDPSSINSNGNSRICSLSRKILAYIWIGNRYFLQNLFSLYKFIQIVNLFPFEIVMVVYFYSSCKLICCIIAYTYGCIVALKA